MKLPMFKQGLAVAGLIVASVSMNAGALVNGATTALTPTVPGVVPPGVVTHSGPSLNPGVWTATVRSAVEANGAGELTFYYQIENWGSSVGSLMFFQVPVPHPTDPSTLDATQLSGAGVVADSASFATSVPTDSVGVLYITDSVDPGETGLWIKLETKYKKATLGKVGVLGTSTTADISALVPVPEPTTYAGLFALGLAGFAAYRRYRA